MGFCSLLRDVHGLGLLRYTTISMLLTLRVGCVCVCVCVTPCTKWFNATVFHYNHSTRQGGKASSDEPCPTKLSRWRGSTERRLGVYLLSCPQAVTRLFHGLIHGGFA